jgi:hypothetical protein
MGIGADPLASLILDYSLLRVFIFRLIIFIEILVQTVGLLPFLLVFLAHPAKFE